MNIKTITVVGANGTMGKNVSGIFASFGNVKVFMVCRNIIDAEKAIEEAALSVRTETIKKNLIAKTYEDLEECISKSDLVFESVAEDYNVKLDVYKKIDSCIHKDIIIATGTSGLSINKLSEGLSNKNRNNYLGIHMFNPPYNLSFCELIPSKYIEEKLVMKIKEYLQKKLFRDVVIVKDAPAFLGNRIGFQFINEALIYAEKYKNQGGIDYIDAILGNFSGRSMGPIATSDFVGLDIHKAIVDNLYNNTNDYMKKTFILPEYAENLIKKNQLGRKTKGGLFRVSKDENDKKIFEVYDIENNEYREIHKYKFTFAEKMKQSLKEGDYKLAIETLINEDSIESKICLEFLLKYVVYSLYTSLEVGEDIHSADYAMGTGFNWVPPLALIEAFELILPIDELIQKYFDGEYLELINIQELLSKVQKSKFDYRKFLKAE